ncbi:MAG: FliM/FliN family flagellar motor switch protein [Pseudomonadota bacterium]
MTAEDDIIVADDPEPAVPGSVESVDDGFLTELMRSQFRKKLDLVSEIEEYASSLEEAIAAKMASFISREVSLNFREISMFQNAILDTPNSFENSLFIINGEERLITSFVFGNPTFQQMLAMAMTTGNPQPGSGNLSAAERRLFFLFIDLLSTALFETIDVIPEFGIPQKPQMPDQAEFLLYAKDLELICFIFDIEMDGVEDSFVLMSPLSLFAGSSNTDEKDTEPLESPEEIEWRHALHNQIENIPVPLSVELACADMLVSDINNFEVGQELQLPIKYENLNVNADLIHTMMRGELEITGKKLHLKITNGAE